MLLRLALLLFGWLGCGAAALASMVAVPPLSARVTDVTGTLAAEQVAHLEATLAGFEARKGAQVVVLMLPTTGDETIEQFGIRVMEAWKIGRKGVDDGVILIVAKNDRRLRIEVGYGLEGALNDATAKRIIAESITPQFKAGDFGGGIAAGVDAMLAVIDGEPLPPVSEAAAGAAGESSGIDGLGEGVFLVGLAAMAIGGAVLRFFLGTLLGSAIVGAIAAAVGWLLATTLLGALIGFAVGFFVALFGLDLLLSGIFGGSSGGGSSGGGGSGGGAGASGSW